MPPYPGFFLFFLLSSLFGLVGGGWAGFFLLLSLIIFFFSTTCLLLTRFFLSSFFDFCLKEWITINGCNFALRGDMMGLVRVAVVVCSFNGCYRWWAIWVVIICSYQAGHWTLSI